MKSLANQVTGPYRPLTRSLLGKIKRGWEAIPGLSRSIANRRGGWGILWLAVQPAGKSAYDRPQFVLDPSVMVVIKSAAGCVAVIETVRTHRLRLLDLIQPMNGLGYLAQLIDHGLFAKLMSGEPVVSVELPSGNVDVSDFNGFVEIGVDPTEIRKYHYRFATANAAKREAREETGLAVEIVQLFMEALNPNPAWFTHADSVAVARCVSAGNQELDPMEMPKKLRWYTPNELRELIRTGRIFDARSIAALYVAGVL